MSAVLAVLVLLAHVSGAAALLLPMLPLCALLLIVLKLSGLQLRIDDLGLEYRDAVGKSFILKFSEIATLTSTSKSIGRGTYQQSTFHLRDGRRVRANLFPFGTEVYRLLQHRIGDSQ